LQKLHFVTAPQKRERFRIILLQRRQQGSTQVAHFAAKFKGLR
jgi:septum formation topological specificity factor MinE